MEFSRKGQYKVSFFRRKQRLYINGKRASLITESVRLIYLDKPSRSIIKIDIGSLRNNQSYKEVKVWKDLTKRDSIYFAEILDHGQIDKDIYWIAQPLLNITSYKWPAYSKQRVIQRLSYKYDIKDIRIYQKFKPGTITPITNFMFDNKGNPIIYDFGW